LYVLIFWNFFWKFKESLAEVISKGIEEIMVSNTLAKPF
jgi:hypothetical protein